jgi:HTH-type transcriptional regulator/antitoxin HigA
MTKPIRNASDYESAKQQIERLIKTNADGSNSDRIEVLVALLERYERTHLKIDAPNPVAAIRLRMDQSALTPRDLEPYIGSRARVSEVLSGKRSLSIDMIRALHEGLGIPYESLIGKAGMNAATDVEVNKPLIKRLNQLGFAVSAENIARFIQEHVGENYAPALARKTRTQRASAKSDKVALLVWQAAVLSLASQRRTSGIFDPKKLTSELFRKVARLSVLEDGPKRAVDMLADLGIAVLFFQTLPGTFLDGAAMISRDGRPIIALTLRHDRIDNFWFTLLHELAHLALHYDLIKADLKAFFDDLDLGPEDDIEREADLGAQRALIPPQLLDAANWNAYSSMDDISSVSQHAGVHISVVAGRWQRDHSDYRKFSRLIERDTLRPIFLSA